MKYTYFITYSFKLANVTAEGNTAITINGEIDSLEDIRKMESIIAKDVGVATVVLTNFRLLKTTEA